MSFRSARGALCAALLALPGCRGDRATDLVQQERLGVIAWTLPPGGSMTAEVELQRSALGAESTWEISAPMSWDQYRAWNRERSKGGYTEARSGDGRSSFARTLPGDRFAVDVVAIAVGPPVRIRVTFTAAPD
jgi:hypothetical protein